MGKFAFACISTKYLDENHNIKIPTEQHAEVLNWGWSWSDEEAERYWNMVQDETKGTCVTKYHGEEVWIERFEAEPKMVYYIPGNGNNHLVSGITKENYEHKMCLVDVYCATEDFDEALEVYNSMDKSKFWMLDLLSYDAHFAVRSTRRKICS